MQRFFAFALFFSLSPATALAAGREALRPLVFQANKNHVQVLAQRFEYSLEDASRMRIGDILIDSTKLRFSLEKTDRGDRLHVVWPAALLTEGRLSLLNHNGKAVWSEPFDPRSLRVGSGETPTDEDLRSDEAHYTSSPLPSQIVADLPSEPFLTFCVSRESEDTKIYLCSNEFYVRLGDDGSREIRPRSITQKESAVDINGKSVEPQGLVYLQEPAETLFMRARLESGATLELVTHRKDVDFKDVLRLDDKRLRVRFRGAEPARKKNAKRIDADEWEVTLPMGRPYFFILGGGGIPMRQEFDVRGALPTEDVRAYIHPLSPDKTYSAEVELRGVRPENVRVGTEEKTATVRPLPQGRFAWTVSDLKAGETNRRFLTLEAGDRKFVSGFDIARGRAARFDVDALAAAPAGVGWLSLGFRRELESFFGSEFRWGWGAEAVTHVGSKAEHFPGVDFLTASLRWRATPGFAFVEPSFSAALLVSSVAVNGRSNLAVGAELSQEFLGRGWVSWWDARARGWLVPSSSSDEASPRLRSAMTADISAFHALVGTGSLKLGFGLELLKTTPELDGESVQMTGSAGYSVRF